MRIIVHTNRKGLAMTADTAPTAGAANTVDDTIDLDLDVRIVVAGPVAAALMGSTDNGCDTRKDGDC